MVITGGSARWTFEDRFWWMVGMIELFPGEQTVFVVALQIAVHAQSGDKPNSDNEKES